MGQSLLLFTWLRSAYPLTRHTAPFATLCGALRAVGHLRLNVGDSWHVGDEQHALSQSQLVRFLDASVAQANGLTILALPHLTDRIAAGLTLPEGSWTHLASAEARTVTAGNLLAPQHGGQLEREEGGSRSELSAATHVLLLDVQEAEEAAVLAAVAPGARVAACRGRRFYLSEGEEGDGAALVDYSLPHPRIFGPGAEAKLLGLLAHLFACKSP